MADVTWAALQRLFADEPPLKVWREERCVALADLARETGIAIERLDQLETDLPAVMARADARAGQIERAVVDLAETVLLSHRQGERFAAVVTDTDDRGSRIQLRDVPVVARIIDTGLRPGSSLNVQLTGVDTGHRLLRFAPV